MNEEIRSILMKKQNEKTKHNRLVLKDVNADLITALLAVPVYGKDARDEEILSIIINAGTLSFQSVISKIKKEFEEKLKGKQLKKSKDGFVRDKEGFIVLKPR